MNSGVGVGKNRHKKTRPGYRDIGNKHVGGLYGFPDNGVQDTETEDTGTGDADIDNPGDSILR